MEPTLLHSENYDKLQSWLDRGDFIGVFRNEALDSISVGRIVYIPISPENEEKVSHQTTLAGYSTISTPWAYCWQRTDKSMESFIQGIDCPQCGGTGEKPKRRACKKCEGFGSVAP